MTPEFLTNSSTARRNSGKNSLPIDGRSNAVSSDRAAFQQALKEQSTDRSTETPRPSTRQQKAATESEEARTDRQSATESQPSEAPESSRSRQADREPLSEGGRRTSSRQPDAPANVDQSSSAETPLSDHSPQEPEPPVSGSERTGQIRRIDAGEGASADPTIGNPSAESEPGDSSPETGKTQARGDTRFPIEVVVESGNTVAFETTDPADVGTLPSLLRRSNDRPVNFQPTDIAGESDVPVTEIGSDAPRSLRPEVPTKETQRPSGVDTYVVPEGVLIPDDETSGNAAIPASRISSTDPFLLPPSFERSGSIGAGGILPENIQFAAYDILPVPTLPSLRSDVTVTAPIRQPVAAGEEISAAVSAALGGVIEENVAVAEAQASRVETATPESEEPPQQSDAGARNDVVIPEAETTHHVTESHADGSEPLILPSLSGGQKPDSLPRASFPGQENPAMIERSVIPEGATDVQAVAEVTNQRGGVPAEDQSGTALRDSLPVTDRRTAERQVSHTAESVKPVVRPNPPSSNQIETPDGVSTVRQTESGPDEAEYPSRRSAVIRSVEPAVAQAASQSAIRRKALTTVDERVDSQAVQVADGSSAVTSTQSPESVTPVRPRGEQSGPSFTRTQDAAGEQPVSSQTTPGLEAVGREPDTVPSEKYPSKEQVRSDLVTQGGGVKPSVVNSETALRSDQTPSERSTVQTAVSATPSHEVTNTNTAAASVDQQAASVGLTSESERPTRSESRPVNSSPVTVPTDVPMTESRENQSAASAGASSENSSSESQRLPADQPLPDSIVDTRSASVREDSLTASANSTAAESVTSPSSPTEVPATKATSAAQPVSASSPVSNVSEVSGAVPVREPVIPMEIQDAVSAIQDASSGDQHIRVRLNPRELGTMLVDVSRTEAGIVARMEVESAAARVAILESMPELQQSLNRAGAVVDRVEVVLNEPRAETGRQESDQPQQREQQQSRQDRQSSGQRQSRDEQNQRRQQNQQHNSGNESEAAADQPAGHQTADGLDIKL